jgi:rfaE bifunctional protein kinase chain/domain
MSRENILPGLRELVERLGSQRVVLFGDIMLDCYWWGDITRISPEAPVPILRKRRVSASAGGAANAALNLAALGADVVLFGVIGRDEPGRQITQILRDHQIGATQLFTDSRRPTTTKTRFVSQHQHILRVDEEDQTPIDSDLIRAVMEAAEREIQNSDIVVISDYAKGFVTGELLRKIVDRCIALKKSILVDPKGSDFTKYEGVTVLKPNRAELATLTNMPVDSHAATMEAGRWLLHRLKGTALVITEGSDGMTILGCGEREIEIPTVARQVFDVTGAGDTVIATLASALAVGADLHQATVLANHAAGYVVGEFGATTISKTKLLDSLKD